MSKGFSYRFYHSGEWARARQLALDRDSSLCQHCLKQGIVTPATMVHHIIELKPSNIGDPNISTNLDNLISLCDLCHKKVHGWARQGSARQGLAFDADGNLISLDDADTDSTQTQTRGSEPAKQQVRAASHPPIANRT